MKRTFAIGLFLLLAGCGGASTNPAHPAGGRSATGFENPGGMWMPSQLVAHADTLRKLGLEIDIAQLADPTAFPLGAVVNYGGCSASFVSPDGLIATNHHCARRALQYHSTPEANLQNLGYLAKTRAEEKWNGPTSRVFVSQAFVDVTDQVLTGLDKITDDQKRHDVTESRRKEIVAACEKDRPGIRCEVRAFFRGAQYMKIEKLEIRDVRLVYAPRSGIGWFGGDEDNWMWPRHTGDYSFVRAYVGPDGKPADYSKNNVPYRPKHVLEVATAPLKKGDLVMVVGYPGRTSRHRTAAEVDEATHWSYPGSIKRNEEFLDVLRAVSKKDPKAAVKAQGYIFYLENSVKNNRGMVDGLLKGGLAKSKAKLERELATWIAADETRKNKYGDVLSRMNALHADAMKTRDRDVALSATGHSRLLGTAETIVRMAEERAKKDADRKAEYQQRNWKLLEAGFAAMEQRYNRTIDHALFEKALDQAGRDVATNGGWLQTLMGKIKYSPAAAKTFVARAYQLSRLENKAVRIKLLKTATTKQLRASTDPFIRMALALRPLHKEIEERGERKAGAMALLVPRYIAARRAFSDAQIAPDANSTLRVTYGTVRGYRKTPDSDMYEPFTTLSQVVAKHRGVEPFDVPENLRAAVSAKRFGAYVDSDLGEVPVNFLADLDITGGNSGSATINGRGELVGLVFDGNYEAMASDWLFIPSVTRSIHLDIRYALWIMDAVDNADHLLEEMGVTPSVPPVTQSASGARATAGRNESEPNKRPRK